MDRRKPKANSYSTGNLYTVRETMDEKKIKEVMRFLGSKRSAKKTAAVRKNGAKGGAATKEMFEKRKKALISNEKKV